MNPTIAMSFKQLSSKVREVYLNTRAEVEGKDGEIAKLKESGEQKDAEIAALKANAPVAELEVQVAELKDQVAELEERDARVKLFVDKLMGLKDANAAHISELEIKNAELESRFASLGAEMAVVMADKAKLEAQMENLVDHNADLAADFDDMEARASRFEEDNADLVATVMHLESLVTAHEDDIEQWKSAHAHYADLLHEAAEMNAAKDAEIEELHSKMVGVVADPEIEELHGDVADPEPASKKRRRGDGALRNEVTYDHVSVADGKLLFKTADADHPATDAKIRYVDVITSAGRSYNRYYVVRDGKEKMFRSKADLERAFGLAPTRKYVRNL
jgi:chromosome segregation ATPase